MSFSSSGDLPNPGLEPASPALAGGFFAIESLGKHIKEKGHLVAAQGVWKSGLSTDTWWPGDEIPGSYPPR